MEEEVTNRPNVNKKEEGTSKVMQAPQQNGEADAANDYNSYAPDFDESLKVKPKPRYIRLKNANESAILRFRNAKPDRKRMDNFKGKALEPVPVYTYTVTTPDKPNEEQYFDVT
jgi:hypothetical protein